MQPAVLTVSELTRQIQDCLEGNFPSVAVRGEISGCSTAGSGHVYFTLKDDDAQIRAVIWRSRAARVRFDITDGLQVVAVGGLDVYPARGSYQLVVEDLIPHGIGPLELAFRQLHDRLAAEGLFAPERKRPLPRFPRRIALVTSPDGAAVRDMLQVITRRWRAARVLVIPVPVQGEGAAARIAAGIRTLARIPGIDVAIVGRGGGSLEDLWAFNEEVVARAIAASPVPIISAVGHEIDVTIADLVADRRALTPSEAGEIVVPDERELLVGLQHVHSRMTSLLRERAAAARARLNELAARRPFARPLDPLRLRAERLDDCEQRLHALIRQRHAAVSARWKTAAAALDALSPLRVLQRGYTLTLRAATGAVVRTPEELNCGEQIVTRFRSGTASSRVESVHPDADP
jgi:exodeoxyribonuclease VII large subunit